MKRKIVSALMVAMLVLASLCMTGCRRNDTDNNLNGDMNPAPNAGDNLIDGDEDSKLNDDLDADRDDLDEDLRDDMDELGNISINGQFLDEPYISEKSLGECDIEFPYQVPDEKWFLMGDSRTISVDSRNTAVGCISKEQIVGKLVYRVWPLEGFGAL